MKGLSITATPHVYAETTINDIPYGSIFFGSIMHPRTACRPTRGSGFGGMR